MLGCFQRDSESDGSVSVIDDPELWLPSPDESDLIALIEILREARFLEIEGEYPFETMWVTGALDSCIQKCIGANVSLEKVIVDLQFELLANR